MIDAASKVTVTMLELARLRAIESAAMVLLRSYDGRRSHSIETVIPAINAIRAAMNTPRGDRPSNPARKRLRHDSR